MSKDDLLPPGFDHEEGFEGENSHNEANEDSDEWDDDPIDDAEGDLAEDPLDDEDLAEFSRRNQDFHDGVVDDDEEEEDLDDEEKDAPSSRPLGSGLSLMGEDDPPHQPEDPSEGEEPVRKATSAPVVDPIESESGSVGGAKDSGSRQRKAKSEYADVPEVNEAAGRAPGLLGGNSRLVAILGAGVLILAVAGGYRFYEGGGQGGQVSLPPLPEAPISGVEDPAYEGYPSVEEMEDAAAPPVALPALDVLLSEPESEGDVLTVEALEEAFERYQPAQPAIDQQALEAAVSSAVRDAMAAQDGSAGLSGNELDQRLHNLERAITALRAQAAQNDVRSVGEKVESLSSRIEGLAGLAEMFESFPASEGTDVVLPVSPQFFEQLIGRKRLGGFNVINTSRDGGMSILKTPSEGVIVVFEGERFTVPGRQFEVTSIEHGGSLVLAKDNLGDEWFIDIERGEPNFRVPSPQAASRAREQQPSARSESVHQDARQSSGPNVLENYRWHARFSGGYLLRNGDGEFFRVERGQRFGSYGEVGGLDSKSRLVVGNDYRIKRSED